MQFDIDIEPTLKLAHVKCKSHISVAQKHFFFRKVNLRKWIGVAPHEDILWQPERKTNRRTESDAYEPTMQLAQVGSMSMSNCIY